MFGGHSLQNEFTQQVEEARSQHLLQEGNDYPPISEGDTQSQVVGNLYKGCIYEMGTYYSSGSMSLVSVTRSFVAEDHEVRDHVDALNPELQTCAQWLEEVEAHHKKELKKMKANL